MDSVFYIVKNLSDKEVKSFKQLFLARKKGGHNKKRELFEALLKSQTPADFKKFVQEQHYSRQNYYQLVKRLRDNLYDFLFSFHHAKNDDEQFDEEMECHKKLYCVKVLLDRNMQDQAQKVLEETIIASDKQQLRGIYFEAFNLKNKYFPLAESQGPPRDVASRYLNDIKDSYCQNGYIRQYLAESVIGNPDSDLRLRSNLLKFMKQRKLNGESDIMDHLYNINILFYQQKFVSAYSSLKILSNHLRNSPHQTETSLQGLILLELVKACICIGNYTEGRSLLDRAESYFNHRVESPFNHLDYWLAIVFELKYVVALRSAEVIEQTSALNEMNNLLSRFDSAYYQSKWNLYLVWHHYQLGDYREAIKLVNAKTTVLQRSHNEHALLKMIELMSIYQLQDTDWFYYKSESLRKQLNGRSAATNRIRVLFSLLQKCQNEINVPAMIEKVEQLESTSPWHPLSYELLNVSEILVSFASSVHSPLFTDH